jgi:hypothetical protein
MVNSVTLISCLFFFAMPMKVKMKRQQAYLRIESSLVMNFAEPSQEAIDVPMAGS